MEEKTAIKNYDKKKGQKYAILFNSFNQVITNTMTGDIMALFLADVLMFSTGNITFIISMISLLAIVRVMFLLFLENKNITKLIKISVIVKMFCTGLLLLLPIETWNFYKYIILIAIYQIAVEFGVGMCWQPLMRQITDSFNRGKFFSKMRFVFMLIHTAYLAFVALYVGEKINVISYKIFLSIAMFGLLLQLVTIEKIKGDSDSRERKRFGEKKLIQRLKANKSIIWALLMELLFLSIGFSLNVLYLKNVLHYTADTITIYITIYSLTGTFALPIIGKYIDKSYRKSSFFIVVMYVLYMCVIILLPPHHSGKPFAFVFLLLLAAISGVIFSSVYLFTTVVQHRMVKNKEDSFLVLNLYQMVVYFASFLIINICGKVLSHAKMISIHLPFADLNSFNLFTVLLIIFAVFGVRKIVDKVESTLS